MRPWLPLLSDPEKEDLELLRMNSDLEGLRNNPTACGLEAAIKVGLR